MGQSHLKLKEIAALLALAATAEDAPSARLEQLGVVASQYERAGHAAACDLALRAGIQLIEAVAGGVGVDRDGSPEQVRLGWPAHQIGLFASNAGRPEVAQQYYERAGRLYAASGRRDLEAAIWHNIASLQWERDDERALVSFRKAAQLEVAGEDRVSRVDTLSPLAVTEARWGDAASCDRAFDVCLRLLEAAAADADVENAHVAACAHRAGIDAGSVKRVDVAIAAHDLARRLYEELGDHPRASTVCRDLVRILARNRRGEQALAWQRACVAVDEESPDLLVRVQRLHALADAAARWGEPDERDAAVKRARGLLEQAVRDAELSPSEIVRRAHALGRFAESIRRPALARPLYELVLPLVEAGGSPLEVSVVQRDIGDTWKTEGDGDAALVSYRAAAQRSDGIPPLSRAQMLSTLADAEARWGEAPAAGAALATALTLLRSVVAQDEEHDAEQVRRTARQLARVARALARPEAAEQASRLARGDPQDDARSGTAEAAP